MPTRRRSQRWRLHAALVVGLTICLVGFAVELHRGLGGNLPAWVYVAEWPIFAVVGSVMWWRLLHDEEDDEKEPTPSRPPSPPGTEAEPHDPGLEAWQTYVARLEAGDRSDPE